MRKGIRLKVETALRAEGFGGSCRILPLYNDVFMVTISKKRPPGCRQCQPIVNRLA